MVSEGFFLLPRNVRNHIFIFMITFIHYLPSFIVTWDIKNLFVDTMICQNPNHLKS